MNTNFETLIYRPTMLWQDSNGEFKNSIEFKFNQYIILVEYECKSIKTYLRKYYEVKLKFLQKKNPKVKVLWFYIHYRWKYVSLKIIIIIK